MSKKVIHWPKVVLFGDSITQRSFEPQGGCWGALLADTLQRVADVIPRGFSGYNSRHCNLIKEQVFGAGLPASDVAAITILLGSNDANEPESPGGQHVPLAEYGRNLTAIIAYLEGTLGISRNRLVLMSPPNYFHQTYIASRSKPDIPIKSNLRVGEYAAEAGRVAAQQGVTFLDLYELFSRQANSEQLFCDGLHLSLEGAQLLHAHLSPLVVKKVEQFAGGRPLELLVNFPLWADIDTADPAKGLLGQAS